eukprot:4242904-Pyramimonas_sp.AAC.1
MGKKTKESKEANESKEAKAKETEESKESKVESDGALGLGSQRAHGVYNYKLTVTALKRPARSGVAEDKPETGFGKYGTAAPLTAHRGRSRPAERNSEGKTILDAVTKACQEVLTRFTDVKFLIAHASLKARVVIYAGNPDLISNESMVPKLVRNQSRYSTKGFPLHLLPNTQLAHQFTYSGQTSSALEQCQNNPRFDQALINTLHIASPLRDLLVSEFHAHMCVVTSQSGKPDQLGSTRSL